jgi:hypothetical protein
MQRTGFVRTKSVLQRKHLQNFAGIDPREMEFTIKSDKTEDVMVGDTRIELVTPPV